MTSLLDRLITAASDDGACRWHSARLWQTRAKLLKLNLICIISSTTSEKIWTKVLRVKKKINSPAGKRTARFLLAAACVSYVSWVHCAACVALDGNHASYLLTLSLHTHTVIRSTVGLTICFVAHSAL